MKVAVFGLGYVGTVSLGCLAALGHDVTGVDINAAKVEMINAGISPVVEPGLNEMIGKEAAGNRIKAVASAADTVPLTDVSLVCVGTPSDAAGNLDLLQVERVCGEIGAELPRARGYHVVVIRSTMLPGSTEKVVIPVLEEHSGLRAGHDFGVCFNPEFLREGSAIKDFYNPAFTVLGRHDARGAETAGELFKDINSSAHIVPLRTAEMIKYACNAFHALKVVFANEIGNICKTEGVDGRQVMEIFCQDRILNLSPAYLKPGFAFGGSCLPKDLRALNRLASRLGLTVPVLEAAAASNLEQIERGVEMVMRTGGERIGILGVTFKPGTDDLRESPFIELARSLLDRGRSVMIYDEDIAQDRLLGANKAYVEERIPDFTSLLCASADDILDGCDVIVAGSSGGKFRDILYRARPEQHIVDFTRAVEDPDEIAARYQGICW